MLTAVNNFADEVIAKRRVELEENPGKKQSDFLEMLLTAEESRYTLTLIRPGFEIIPCSHSTLYRVCF